MADEIGGVKKGEKLSYVDAARAVLVEEGGALHYTAITDKALAAGILDPRGKTPHISMHVSLMLNIRRAQAVGETPDFAKVSPGHFGLVAKGPADVEAAVRAARGKLASQVLKQLKAMEADQFHQVLADLLVAMQYENVEVVDGPQDKDVDIIGTVSAGGVPLKVGVQAKAFKASKRVSVQVVRSLRDALEVHGCWLGWVITTGGFTEGVRAIPDEMKTKRPISLTDGTQLADLLIEHEVGVQLVPLSVPRFVPGGPFVEDK